MEAEEKGRKNRKRRRVSSSSSSSSSSNESSSSSSKSSNNDQPPDTINLPESSDDASFDDIQTWINDLVLVFNDNLPNINVDLRCTLIREIKRLSFKLALERDHDNLCKLFWIASKIISYGNQEECATIVKAIRVPEFARLLSNLLNHQTSHEDFYILVNLSLINSLLSFGDNTSLQLPSNIEFLAVISNEMNAFNFLIRLLRRSSNPKLISLVLSLLHHFYSCDMIRPDFSESLELLPIMKNLLLTFTQSKIMINQNTDVIFALTHLLSAIICPNFDNSPVSFLEAPNSYVKDFSPYSLIMEEKSSAGNNCRFKIFQTTETSSENTNRLSLADDNGSLNHIMTTLFGTCDIDMDNIDDMNSLENTLNSSSERPPSQSSEQKETRKLCKYQSQDLNHLEARYHQISSELHHLALLLFDHKIPQLLIPNLAFRGNSYVLESTLIILSNVTSLISTPESCKHKKVLIEANLLSYLTDVISEINVDRRSDNLVRILWILKNLLTPQVDLEVCERISASNILQILADKVLVDLHEKLLNKDLIQVFLPLVSSYLLLSVQTSRPFPDGFLSKFYTFVQSHPNQVIFLEWLCYSVKIYFNAFGRMESFKEFDPEQVESFLTYLINSIRFSKSDRNRLLRCASDTITAILKSHYSRQVEMIEPMTIMEIAHVCEELTEGDEDCLKAIFAQIYKLCDDLINCDVLPMDDCSDQDTEPQTDNNDSESVKSDYITPPCSPIVNGTIQGQETLSTGPSCQSPAPICNGIEDHSDSDSSESRVKTKRKKKQPNGPTHITLSPPKSSSPSPSSDRPVRSCRKRTLRQTDNDEFSRLKTHVAPVLAKNCKYSIPVNTAK